MAFSCDFETTTLIDKVSVWLWGITEIGNTLNFNYGENISEFFRFFEGRNEKLYFHNLKFDGNFIIYELFKQGYTYKKERKYLQEGNFTTIISDMGQFYYIGVKMKNGGYIEIYDSFKIIPFPVKDIAKTFNLPIKKGEIDYTRHNTPCDVTEEEIAYLKNDCEIVARALNILFNEGNTKMTTASNAFKNYLDIVGGKKDFKKIFPPLPLDIDRSIRRAYKGGFAYVSPNFKDKTVSDGIVLDVNSLYPSVMYGNCHKTFMNGTPLPFGEPIYFEGKYVKNKNFPLFIQAFKCSFELKENHIPTIQIKRSIFKDTEYLESSGDEEPVLYLTNIDLKLFFDHYNVYNPQFLYGYMFRASTDLFKDYIDIWIAKKNKATIEHNGGIRTIAKLMLNSLYGRFALNPEVCSKYPVYDEKYDKVRYKLHDCEMREPVYIPIGAFVTAWARYVTISSAQKVYPRFMYADTDSLHLEGKEIPAFLWVDDVELGAWKHESTFTKAKYLRAKRYIEIINGETCVTCAGLPKQSKKYVSFDNFVNGSTYGGKLVPKVVSGGVVLKETEFTLKT